MDPRSNAGKAGRPGISKEKQEAVLILSGQGKTPQEIKEAVGISLSKVYEFLRHAGRSAQTDHEATA